MITNINDFRNINEARETTQIEQDVMHYLNDLRDSGVTNMFGATPYILREFPELEKTEASRILVLWMSNFREDRDYSTIQKEDYDPGMEFDDVPGTNVETHLYEIDWIELEKDFITFSKVYPQDQYPQMRQTFNFIKDKLLNNEIN